MNVTIYPSSLSGCLSANASKSAAHRLLICAALSDHTTDIDCAYINDDIKATAECLRKLGAHVTRTKKGFRVLPIPFKDGQYHPIKNQTLNCQESGSTLRFMLSVVSALGADATLEVLPSLASRPISALYNKLFIAGANLSEDGKWPMSIKGKIRGGEFILPGNISSQFASGILLASPCLPSTCTIKVKNPIESKPYIDLTIDCMRQFGVVVKTSVEDEYTIYTVDKSQHYTSPSSISCEGDWSSMAYFLCAGALSENGISTQGLNMTSMQADRAILAALSLLGARVQRNQTKATVAFDTRLRGASISCTNFPDLVPPICAILPYIPGTCELSGIRRLAFKESNRIKAITNTLSLMGADITSDDDTITIRGGKRLPSGATLPSYNDHRIVMMASIAACFAENPTVITNAQVVSKSYPNFFEELESLGAKIKKEA